MARERIVEVKVRGDEELHQVLKELGDDQQVGLILRPALMEAAKPVQAALAAAAPQSKGKSAAYRRAHGKVALNTTMGISFKKSGGRRTAANSTSVSRVRIGPMYPQGAHGHLTEFGTADRHIILRDEQGRKVVDPTWGGKKFVVNPNSKSGRGWMRGKTPYLKNLADGFRGKVNPQGWMRKTWDRMVSPTMERLQAIVAEKIIARGQRLRAKHEKTGGGR